jgi:hypothetical protein
MRALATRGAESGAVLALAVPSTRLAGRREVMERPSLWCHRLSKEAFMSDPISCVGYGAVVEAFRAEAIPYLGYGAVNVVVT